MDQYYFECTFEEDQWRLRATVYRNDLLHLYEVEPEDRRLLARFGIKFVVQQKRFSLEIRCSNPVEGHGRYEEAVLDGLKEHLVTKQLLS